MESFINDVLGTIKYKYLKHRVHHKLRILFTFRYIFTDPDYRGKTLLDVGCSSGIYSLFFAKKRLKIDAFDIINLSEAKSLAARHDADADIYFFNMDAENIEIKKKYDYIFCSEVLEHLSDHSAAIRSFSKLLNPGGRIIISLPNSFSVYMGMIFIKEMLAHKLNYKQIDPHCKFPFWNVGPLFKRKGFTAKLLGSVYFLPIRKYFEVDLKLGVLSLFKYIGAFCFYEVTPIN